MFNLVRQLTDTGLYHDSDALSTGELQAYEKQLQDVLEWQEQLKNELALDTTDWLLPRWEKIYDLQPKDKAKRERQLALLNKERARGVLTQSKITAIAHDYGFDVKINKQIRPFNYQIVIESDHAELFLFDKLITEAEPSHQSHSYNIKNKNDNKLQFISSQTKVYYNDLLQCGAFYAGGENGLC